MWMYCWVLLMHFLTRIRRRKAEAFIYNESEDTQGIWKVLTEEEASRAGKASMAEATREEKLEEGGFLLSVCVPAGSSSDLTY